jgi:hypothetical protein
MAVDPATVLLSARLLDCPQTARQLAIGHELAHTLQLARGGSAAPEILEAEAWQAAKAAMNGRRQFIRLGGVGPLAISACAILLTEAANLYYKSCKKCSFKQGQTYLDIAAGDRVLLNPMLFESLLDTMIAKQTHTRFVFFTHASFDGMLMPLTASHVQANKEFGTLQPRSHVLLMLMQIDELFVDVDVARKADPSTATEKWHAIKRKIGADAGMSGPDAVQSWLDQRLKTLRLTERQLRDLLDKRHQLQARKIKMLEFRSCFIGSKRHSLQVLRRFFGAEVVGAPTEFSAFGFLNVQSHGGNLGADAYKEFIKAHTDVRKFTEKDGLTKGKVALACKLLPNSHDAETYAAATTAAAMKEWIEKFLDGPSTPPLNNIPVHFLAIESAPPGVPGVRDGSYWDHIAYAGPGEQDELPESLFTAGAAQP